MMKTIAYTPENITQPDNSCAQVPHVNGFCTIRVKETSLRNVWKLVEAYKRILARLNQHREGPYATAYAAVRRVGKSVYVTVRGPKRLASCDATRGEGICFSPPRPDTPPYNAAEGVAFHLAYERLVDLSKRKSIITSALEYAMLRVLDRATGTTEGGYFIDSEHAENCVGNLVCVNAGGTLFWYKADYDNKAVRWQAMAWPEHSTTHITLLR